MRLSTRILGIIVLILGLITVSNSKAQQLTRNGQTFVQQNDSARSRGIKTIYKYQDNTGIYDVYLSKNGKAFIWKTSKRTGKDYKKYLPALTEEMLKYGLIPDSLCSTHQKNQE